MIGDDNETLIDLLELPEGVSSMEEYVNTYVLPNNTPGQVCFIWMLPLILRIRFYRFAIDDSLV